MNRKLWKQVPGRKTQTATDKLLDKLERKTSGGRRGPTFLWVLISRALSGFPKDERKIPSCFWQGEGKSSHSEVQHSAVHPFQQDLPSRETILLEPNLLVFKNSLLETFFPQFYWETTDTYHCIRLRCTAWWFDIYLLWNYYNRFG